MSAEKLISGMNERRAGNKQTQNRGGFAGIGVPGVSPSRQQFIFDWHQEKLLPTPAYRITPNAQKSELQTDAVEQGWWNRKCVTREKL